MNVNLEGVHAVITGASSGLGYTMAKALAENGATVALSARPGERLEASARDLAQKGLDARALSMDVRSEKSIAAAVARVRKEWGRIDLLVNNAALMMHRVYPDFLASPKPFYEIDPDVFRDMVDTNLTGYFLVARGFLPLMIDQHSGRIVNISTSLSTMNRFAPYGPSRAASEALSNIMAVELKKFGIMVNLLLPGGPVDTGGIFRDSRQEIPFTLLPPEIMADPVVFLASHLADGMSGERIIANEFDGWLKRKGIRP